MTRTRYRRVGSLAAALLITLGAAPAKAAPASPTIQDISTSCGTQNAEVEQAVDKATGAVYEAWMGCSGIGFARSTDGGRTFEAPVNVPGSPGSTYNSWDPSVAVGPDGTVYVTSMMGRSTQWFPVVVASFDHGRTFSQVTELVPPQEKNWGDRPFVAVDPGDGSVYITWDYGPNRSSVTFLCSPTGSCGYSSGDVNVVMQRSTDHARTFGAMTYVSPGFPGSGGDSGPMVIEPNGRLDVLYQGYGITDTSTYAMTPGYEYSTSSTDHGATWSKPVRVGGNVGTMSLDEWWIDGSIGLDSAGNLYATWDTQSQTADTGWLSYSTDHGATWSKPLQAPADTAVGPHIMEVVGGSAGTAYVAWLSAAHAPGYTAYMRTFAIGRGWINAPRQVSTEYGDTAVWPGDTVGLSFLSPSQLVLSWGSATPTTGKKSDIFVAAVPLQ